MSSRVGRLFAVLLVALLGGALIAVTSATQASAVDRGAAPGRPFDVTFCHPVGESYEVIVQPSSIVAGERGDAADAGSIIPPFEGFAGKNWDAAGQRIFDNGCSVPDRPAQPTAEVSTQPEGEVSCADSVRRDRAGTTTTEYVWNEDGWAWEPVTGVVWTDWTSTPLTDDERLECAGARPEDTVVTRTKITESCEKNIVVTDYYDTWTRWTLSETNEWISHVAKEVWDHQDTVKDAFTAEECGYRSVLRDEQSWRCQEKTPTLVTDHYQRVYAWSPHQQAWVLGGEVRLDKDVRAMTADEQIEHSCGQPVIPVAIEFPAFDVFDAECQTGGQLVVVDTDEYTWDVIAHSGTARGGAAAGGSRTYGPGTYDVSADARDGFAFEDGSTRYVAGDVMVDGPDPGVCGYSDDDEQTRPTKVLGASLDGASVPDTSGQTLAAGGVSGLPAGTASVTTPGDAAVAQAPAAQTSDAQAVDAPVGKTVPDPTPPAGMQPVSVPNPEEGVAAPAISVAPLAAGPGGGLSVPAAATTDHASPPAAPNGAASNNAASNKAASNEVVPRLAGSDPAARAHDAVREPGPVAAQAGFVTSAGAGSGVTPYLVLAAGLCLMLMLGLRSRRSQD